MLRKVFFLPVHLYAYHRCRALHTKPTASMAWNVLQWIRPFQCAEVHVKCALGSEMQFPRFVSHILNQKCLIDLKSNANVLSYQVIVGSTHTLNKYCSPLSWRTRKIGVCLQLLDFASPMCWDPAPPGTQRWSTRIVIMQYGLGMLAMHLLDFNFGSERRLRVSLVGLYPNQRLDNSYLISS